MNQDKVLDISWETILKIGIALLCFYIIYLIKDILVWFIFALIISILFNPAIDFLSRLRLPRVISTILVYVAVFGVISLMVYWMAPFFIFEIQQFSQMFPQYFEKISPVFKGLGIEAFESFEKFTETFERELIKASANVFSALGAIFGGIFSAVTIFAMAIFLSLEEKGIDRMVMLLSPKKYEAYFLSLWEKSQKKVAGWFGARILSCVFVGILSFIACYVLNVKYAVSFGMMAGVLDIIPIIGPIIAGAIIVIFTALISWEKALLIFIAFLLIQQIEGNILTPILTKKFMGLPPVLVLIAVLIGGELWGMLGAVLSIPLVGILFEFLRDFLRKRKESDSGANYSSQGGPNTSSPPGGSPKKVVVL